MLTLRSLKKLEATRRYLSTSRIMVSKKDEYMSYKNKSGMHIIVPFDISHDFLKIYFKVISKIP